MADPQKQIEAAREALRRELERETFKQKPPMTKLALLRELRPDIAKMRAQGWTWKAIADVLHDTINVGPDTIRLALGPKKKSTLTSRSKKEQEPVPRTLTGTVSAPKIPVDRFGPPEL